MKNDYLVQIKPLMALLIFALPMIAGNLFQQTYTCLLYTSGRNTTFSDLELETIIKDVDADTYLALIHHRKSVTSRR